MKGERVQALDREFSLTTAWITPLVLAAGFFLLSLVLLSTTYFRDTIDFAIIIERSIDPSELFNPHHLLYLPTARLNFDLWKLLGYTGSSILPSQILSLLAGTAAVLLAYRTVSKIVRTPVVALWLTVLMGFSYALWAYAMQGMPYVFTFAFGLLFFSQLINTTRTPALKQAGFLGLSHALLTLFHQSTLMLFPIALLAFFIVRQNETRREQLTRAALYAVTYFGLVGGAYLIVMFGVLHLTNFHDMYIYLTAYIQDAGNQVRGIGVLQPSRFGMGIFGLGNTVLGETFLIELLSRTSIFQAFIVSTLTGWTQPLSNSIPLPLLLLLTAVFVLVVAGFVFAFVHFLRNWKRIWSNYKVVLILAGVWFLILGLFAEYYYPENRQQWIPASVSFWMLMAVILDDLIQHGTLPRTTQGRNWFVGVLAMFVLALNLFGSMVPAHIPENNLNLTVAEWMRGLVQPGDIVVASEAGDLKHVTAYIHYYTGDLVYATRGIFINDNGAQYNYYVESIQKTMAAHKQVYVLGEVFDRSLVIPELSKYSGLPSDQVLDRVNSLFTGYQLVPVSRPGAPITIYQLMASSASVPASATP